MSLTAVLLTLLGIGTVVVIFALYRGDQVETDLQLPGVRIFLSYRRERRK